MTLTVLSVLKAEIAAPLAPEDPDTLYIHNTTLVDSWAWLRNRSDPRLASVFANEKQYTKRMLKPSEPLARQLYKTYVDAEPQAYKSHPYLQDGYYYYIRQAKKQPYSVHYRIKATAGAKEELILDENRLARGLAFFALGSMSVSPDGRWLAYSVDKAGDENYSLYLKDLSSGKTRSTGISGLSECVWKTDSRTLLLTRINARYQTDTAWAWDRQDGKQLLLYRETDPAWDLGLYASSTHDLIFLSSASKNATEYRFMDSNSSGLRWTLLSPRAADHIYYPDYYKGIFYIHSNLHDQDYAIYSSKRGDAGTADWKAVVKGEAGAPISSFQISEAALVLLRRKAGFECLELWNPSGTGLIRSLVPKEISNLGFWSNPDPGADFFYYTTENELEPFTIRRYNFSTGSDSLEYRSPVPKGLDLGRYQTEFCQVKTADGALIPLRLIYAKGLDRGKAQATLLYGYGAYGDVEDPFFSSSLFPLLDKGLIYAVANIRGGGEFGKNWYDQGRLLNKKNSFTDFVACLDYLLEQQISSKDKLAIQGGSAGGLLIGAVLNLAWDRIRLAVLDVPFVDPVNTMLDPELPLTVQEYEEWGDPNAPEAFDYILSYSPYDNIKTARYPAILISSALNDSRVGYWEGLKYAQKLRKFNSGRQPVIFRLLDEGHTGSTNRFASLREYAQTMAFILRELGL